MADDLTESTVRQHLRDQSGELYCARCLARVLNLDPSATEAAVVALSAIYIVCNETLANWQAVWFCAAAMMLAVTLLPARDAPG